MTLEQAKRAAQMRANRTRVDHCIVQAKNGQWMVERDDSVPSPRIRYTTNSWFKRRIFVPQRSKA
jgi:hypothetical protein